MIAGKAKAPGAKRLLLCVHGFPESHISWRHQLQVRSLFLQDCWLPVNTQMPDAPLIRRPSHSRAQQFLTLIEGRGESGRKQERCEASSQRSSSLDASRCWLRLSPGLCGRISKEVETARLEMAQCSPPLRCDCRRPLGSCV